MTFDPYATSSCYHGVTIVLAGKLQAALPGRLVRPVGTKVRS
jgi:hypothetical protein